MKNYTKLEKHLNILNASDDLKEKAATYILKAVKYPNGRAWADELDMRCHILVEDFARANKLAFSLFDIDNSGKVIVSFRQSIDF